MRIELLGPVVARPAGEDTGVVLGGVRLRGLLARLALDVGRPVGADTLVDDLWGDAAPDGAANALQSLVSRLRRSLGPELVVTAPGGYRLRLDQDAVDAARFGRLVSSATVAAAHDAPGARRLLVEARSLWRGPALADIRDLPFAGPAADRLAERQASAVEDSARLALSTGEAGAEVDALSAQLAAFPLRESTAVVLARTLCATGRQADALAVLDRTRALLAEELGLDPGAELAQTRLDVLRGTPVPGAPSAAGRTRAGSAQVDRPPAPTGSGPAPTGPGHGIPVRAGLSSFVGRDGDVRAVGDLLRQVRLVSLIGPGGAGKTRLARETVAGLVSSNGSAPVETRLAELAPLADPDQIPATLLAAVGGPEILIRGQDDAGVDTTARLVAALAGRDVLLVLDNCEHLVDAAATLAQTLLETNARLRILATSREPLGVPGELLYPVDALHPDDAVALFVDRAAAVRPGFVLTAELAPVVAEICLRLDGQPLPIELAAARLRTLSPAEIAARLDDRFRLLTGGSRTAMARHQTLRAVVDWSWELLSEPERVVARRLAVFAGGATCAAAEEVCSSGGGPPRAEVFDLLTALVDKSLVVAVPQQDGSPTRYRMLATIQDYAAERLDAAAERDAVAAAHAAYFAALAETAEPWLRTADQLVWLAVLRAESDNCAAALRTTIAANDASTAKRLTAGLFWSWLIQGLFEDAMRWSRAVAALPGPAPPAAAALCGAQLAIAELSGGDLAAAQRHLAEAIDLAADVPAPRHPVLDLLVPVQALFVGVDDGPITELAEHSDDPWLRAFAYQIRFQIAENVGDIDGQRRFVRVSHQLFSEIGERFGLGMALNALGELEDIAGNADAAAAAYDQAIELARELGNDDDLPQFVVKRARLSLRNGELRAGIDRLRDALVAVRDSFGAPGVVHLALAEGYRLSGDLEAAREHLAASDVILTTRGAAVSQRTAMHATAAASLKLAEGDLGGCRAHLRDAVSAAVESKDGPVTAVVAELAARIALAAGDQRTAAELLGVATAQRGAMDVGNPEVRATLDAVRTALGPVAADDAVRRGRELPRDEGLALLASYARRR